MDDHARAQHPPDGFDTELVEHETTVWERLKIGVDVIRAFALRQPSLHKSPKIIVDEMDSVGIVKTALMMPYYR